MNKTYTLNQFAEKIGVTPGTVRHWNRTGKLLPAYKTPGGHRRYTEEQVLAMTKNLPQSDSKINIGYVRVPSKKQEDDLERQYQQMEAFLLSQGKPYEIIKSIGSGINYKNPSLQTLVQKVISNKVDTVFVLYKDRLVRFGFDLLSYLFSEFDTEIKVINQSFESPEEELVTDLIQIVSVFSAKLNGKRKYKLQTLKKELENGNSNPSRRS